MKICLTFQIMYLTYGSLYPVLSDSIDINFK